jgi:hypothetical protein
MFCNAASWETKSLSSGGTSTCLMAVSILNAMDSEKLFENERSLKRESGIEEVRSSSEEGLLCHGRLNDKSSVELAELCGFLGKEQHRLK